MSAFDFIHRPMGSLNDKLLQTAFNYLLLEREIEGEREKWLVIILDISVYFIRPLPISNDVLFCGSHHTDNDDQ